MSQDQTAHATETTMCQHIIEANMQTPFALYAAKHRAEYLCTSCLVDAIERRLNMPGQTPMGAASSVSFAQCGHVDGERVCWPCLEAASAEVLGRRSRTFHTEKAKANRLGRIVSLWNRHHDPAGIRRGRHVASIEAEPRITAEERRTRMDAARIADRRERIRRERKFPSTWAIGATGQQPSRIEVVPLVAQSA